MKGYLVTPFRDHNTAKNEWLYWCRKHSKPFVWALKLGRNYDVEVDTIGLSPTVSYRISEEGHAYADDFIRSLELKIHFRSHEIIHLEKVPEERVDALCEELVYIAEIYKLRSSSM